MNLLCLQIYMSTVIYRYINNKTSLSKKENLVNVGRIQQNNKKN